MFGTFALQTTEMINWNTKVTAAAFSADHLMNLSSYLFSSNDSEAVSLGLQQKDLGDFQVQCHNHSYTVCILNSGCV